MMNFENAPDALSALRAYVMALPAETPEHLRDALNNAVLRDAQVPGLINAGEALYANLAVVDEAGKHLCAGLIAFATMHGWNGLGEGRGTAIIKAALREAGETPAWAKKNKAADPEPLQAFTAPVEEAAVVAEPDAPLGSA